DVRVPLPLEVFQDAVRFLVAAVPEQRKGPVRRALVQHRVYETPQHASLENRCFDGNDHRSLTPAGSSGTTVRLIRSAIIAAGTGARRNRSTRLAASRR